MLKKHLVDAEKVPDAGKTPFQCSKNQQRLAKSDLCPVGTGVIERSISSTTSIIGLFSDVIARSLRTQEKIMRGSRLGHVRVLAHQMM